MNIVKIMNEKELIARLKSGEGRDDAFRELLKTYGHKLYWHIRRIVVSHDDAEDVMQETAMRILTGIDGYEGVSEVRKKSSVPVIMLSAKGEVFDKVLGLKMGADDYIIKPFDSNEMVARVRAVLRRYTPQQVAAPEPMDSEHVGNFVEYDNLLINISNYTVVIDGKNLEMPPKELELLYFLASKPNQVFTREQILDRLWGYEYIGDTRTVDVHIKRLREKLPDSKHWGLATVWGIGYKFEVK